MDSLAVEEGHRSGTSDGEIRIALEHYAVTGDQDIGGGDEVKTDKREDCP